MLEVQVLLGCTHIVVLEIAGIVELPHIGDEASCPRCAKRKRTIVKIGIPHRPIAQEEIAKDPNQKSMLEE